MMKVLILIGMSLYSVFCWSQTITYEFHNTDSVSINLISQENNKNEGLVIRYKIDTIISYITRISCHLPSHSSHSFRDSVTGKTLFIQKHSEGYMSNGKQTKNWIYYADVWVFSEFNGYQYSVVMDNGEMVGPYYLINGITNDTVTCLERLKNGNWIVAKGSNTNEHEGDIIKHDKFVEEYTAREEIDNFIEFLYKYLSKSRNYNK